MTDEVPGGGGAAAADGAEQRKRFLVRSHHSVFCFLFALRGPASTRTHSRDARNRPQRPQVELEFVQCLANPEYLECA